MAKAVFSGKGFVLIVSLYFFLFHSIMIRAGDPRRKTLDDYLMRVWAMEHGLPMNSVLDIAQTPDGYLWLGTEIGLARFDGVRFKIFDRENTLPLHNDFILTLMVDHSGCLWIGTRGGGLVRYQNGLFEKVELTEDPTLCREIWVIMEASDHSLWVGGRCGLFRRQQKGFIPIPFDHPVQRYYVTSLLEDRNGRVWMGTRGGGVFLLEKSGDEFNPVPMGLNHVNIEGMYEDRRGRIWVGSDGHGLFHRVRNCWKRYTTAKGLPEDCLRAFYEDDEGNFWIGTIGGGITIFDPDSECFSKFDCRNELPCSVIYGFFEDREKNIWITTGGCGLIKLHEPAVKVYSPKQGLSSNMAVSLMQDQGGAIWVGTWGGGVDRIWKDSILHLDRRDGLTSNAVLSMAQTPEGDLWFGTVGGGLNQCSRKGMQVFTVENGLAGNTVRALYVDAGGTLWIGTANGFVQKFQQGRIVTFAELGHRINAMLVDSENSLWVSTMGNGLHRFNDQGHIEFHQENGLVSDMILSVFEDSCGLLWVGSSRDGLMCRCRDQFHYLSKREGLPDNTIYYMVEDRPGNLWVSSNRGIYSLSRRQINDFLSGSSRSLHPQLLGIEHGLKSLECNGGSQPTGCLTDQGNILFPTTGGVVEINPDDIHLNKFPPPVAIEKILFDGRELQGDPFSIPPGKGNLEISFTAPSFIQPEKIRFLFKLEGVDRDWNETETVRLARYMAIPPGKYRFRVIACNSDGIWNREGAEFNFRWKARFSQALPFKILALFMLFSVHPALIFTRKRYVAWKRKRKRFQTHSLDGLEMEKMLKKLYHLLEVDKVYRNSNLSMKSLASSMLLSQRLLSHLINDRLKRNFFDLINFYRVREAQDLLLHSTATSVLDVCLQVGYNSKSAFNRAFKHFTGLTPSEFVRRGRKAALFLDPDFPFSLLQGSGNGGSRKAKRTYS